MISTTDLTYVINQYRGEGFEVTVLPDGVVLPPFAAGFHPDLLATKEGLHVLVAVKKGPRDLASDPDILEMARVVNAQPGWRFDLVMLGKEGTILEGEEPSIEKVSHLLEQVDPVATGRSTTSALVLAWSALEAAMRRAARTAGLEIKDFSSRYLVGLLYANGLLELEEYDELKRHLKLRDAIVHGLEVPQINASIPLYVAEIARKLLAWKDSEQPVTPE
jgi:hypothetical protein